MIRGLIFDFDGLILDTEVPVYQSWVELFRQHETDLTFDEWSSVIGTSDLEHFNPYQLLEEKTGKVIHQERLESERFAREMALCIEQPILPGVLTIIHAAKDRELKLAIASSSDRDWVVGHLDRLCLSQFFEIVHTSDDVERTKPDPALFNLSLASLNLKPQEAIVFEDSPNGVAAAKAAGIFVVAVPNELTRQLSLDHADIIINSLEEMTLDDIIAITVHG
jgi:HAD superfamily hydrolase (TIGR01509 family)